MVKLFRLKYIPENATKLVLKLKGEKNETFFVMNSQKIKQKTFLIMNEMHQAILHKLLFFKTYGPLYNFYSKLSIWYS